MQKEVFVAGSVKYEDPLRLREEITKRLEESGVRVYCIPVLSKPYAEEEQLAVISQTDKAMRKSDAVIWLPEQMGPSTADEMGMAVALGKPIVAFVENECPTFEKGSALDSLLKSIAVIESLDELLPRLQEVMKLQENSS